MPIDRLGRTRESLPQGYQYGDAAFTVPSKDELLEPFALAWVDRAVAGVGHPDGLSAMTPPLSGPGAEYRRLYDAAKAAEPKIGEVIKIQLPKGSR